jgi:hypothetical protein
MPDIAARGIYFGEAPRWHDGRLWFSDFYGTVSMPWPRTAATRSCCASTGSRPASAGCPTASS